MPPAEPAPEIDDRSRSVFPSCVRRRVIARLLAQTGSTGTSSNPVSTGMTLPVTSEVWSSIPMQKVEIGSTPEARLAGAGRKG